MIGAMTDYTYRSLTNAIRDKASPLREYLDLRFPNVRPLQKDFRSRAGEIRVSPLFGGGGAHGGTLGGAFDFRMRFLIDPSYIPDEVIRSIAALPDHEEAIREVIKRAGEAARGDVDSTDLDRACWALALCAEVYHMGGLVYPGSPLDLMLDEDNLTSQRLLSLIPDDAFRQLRELDELAQKHLLPQLSAPLHLGPKFDGSILCPADADVISNGLLLDFKTTVKGGALSREDLYQLLGYTLFDYSDRYGINSIGIYSARFAALVRWDLGPALDLLAGDPIDLAHERAKVWGLLGGLDTLQATVAHVLGQRSHLK